MRSVRLREYDAVIGIGGRSAAPISWGIAGKVTWIGITKNVRRGVVRFENFRCFGNSGPRVVDVLPSLVRRMQTARHRMIKDEDDIERYVIEVAGEAPASLEYDGSHPCCQSAR